MKILITGASGLIGRASQKSFGEKGYELLLATRSEPKKPSQIQWNAITGFRDEDIGRLEGLDAVIHLAGEGIAGLRWTDEKKKAIRDSRVLGTRSMIEAFDKLKDKPRTFISGSAIGYYGDRGNDEMTESSAAGKTFLAE
ncbi:MAG: NAD-dependent epimerase/dehydratase family protein, partial [bacterium]|nr:NAD-dependent epimerase/dehydratase family protein [bacterium]